jgi:hypothetical protein
MTPLRRVIRAVLVLVVVVAGCESATAVPAGAQQVRVVATPGLLQVTPSTIRAGDVYFVLDLPAQGVRLAFVRSSTGAGGALSDDELARLAQNVDAEGLTSETLDVSCCGNVYKKTLASGRYAFVVTDPTAAQPGLPPRSLATITVEP